VTTTAILARGKASSEGLSHNIIDVNNKTAVTQAMAVIASVALVRPALMTKLLSLS